MRALIECCPQCLSWIDNEGRTPLHLSFKYSIQDPATLVDPMRTFPSLKLIFSLEMMGRFYGQQMKTIAFHYIMPFQILTIAIGSP